MKYRLIFLGITCVLLAGGCSKPEPLPPPARTWHQLLDEMLDPERLADLDQPGARIVSSVDPIGGNDDYNHYLRQGPEGWEVFADLEGPGFVSRFWFTGGKPEQRFQFFFDDEDTPRIDTEVLPFCGGSEPFVPPLAMREPYCYFNLVPIPYQKRLVILSQARVPKPGGWPRHFYQINYSSLAPDQSVASYPRTLSEADHRKLAEIREAWASGSHVGDAEGELHQATDVEVAPGATRELLALEGPGMIRELRMEAEGAGSLTALQQNALLRDLRLQIFWDDADAPSVDVPVGDFFGSVWSKTTFSSMWFGRTGNRWMSRFPMPFQRAARIQVMNEGAVPARLQISVTTRPLAADRRWGYFHAAWNRTTAAAKGTAHSVLKTAGVGKYVGCLLGVTGLDKSWWVLEGDETITVDNEPVPQWLGTGLEDYFNGGWYYQNAHAEPLHGLLFKAPFRTVQYRFHLMDPVPFQRSIDMAFERGPDEASQAYFESVGYYYLDQPAAAASVWAGERGQPPDPVSQATLLPELHNLERMGDTPGAIARIDAYQEQFPGPQFEEILRLRQWAYREYLGETNAAFDAYRQIAQTTTNGLVRQQAEDLLWFHEGPDHALLSLYNRNTTTVFLDGRPLMKLPGNPQRVFVKRIKIGAGTHTIAMEAEGLPYPDWICVHLRTHRGEMITDATWKYSWHPESGWEQPGFDDGQWTVWGATGVKGPPEVPYVFIEPYAHVYGIGIAVGQRPGGDERKQNLPWAARHVFTLGE